MGEKFEKGDKVKVEKSCSGCIPGVVYTLVYPKEHPTSLFAQDKRMRKKDSKGNGCGGCACEYNWILISPKRKTMAASKKPIKFVVFWDDGNGDPKEECATLKEAEKLATDLILDDEIAASDIEIYEVKSKYVVKSVAVALELVTPPKRKSPTKKKKS